MLLDTNILIYAAKRPNGPAAAFVRAASHAISEVTIVEALGFTRLPPAEEA